MLTTEQIRKKYGPPGDDNLVKIVLPFPLRIAWDTTDSVTTLRCHKLISDKLKKVFTEILNAYGIEEIRRLGIDLFGGCYEFRKMRGGNDWSRHSWGIAVDLHPSKNTLKQTSKTALFAKPEYKKMIDIFYANGFVSLGVEKNRDWMHFEIAA